MVSGQSRPSSPASRPLKYSTQPDNEKVILAVARDPAAIGFVDMSQLPPNEKSVKLVKILGQASTKATKSTKNEPRLAADSLPEDYPLARTLMLYVSPNASQTAKDFADFLTPEHCKETIAQYNLLPPLHAEETKLASGPPNPLPKGEGTLGKPLMEGEGTVALASADEPLPLLLDDPDAPKSKQGVAQGGQSHFRGGQALSHSNVAGAAKIGTVPCDQPKPAKAEPTPLPTSQSPDDFALTDNQLAALLGIGSGIIVLAYVIIGRLRAPKHKRLRR